MRGVGGPLRYGNATVATLVFMVGWLGAANALAGTRYAAPTAQGSGNCSSPANACTLAQAVSGSSQGDAVVVAGDEGTYGTSSTPLVATIADPAPDAPGSIEGAPGQPRPVIYTDAEQGFDLFGTATVAGQQAATSVSDLEIVELASGLPTALEVNGNVDHAVVRSPNGAYQACEPAGLPPPQTEVISDSLCAANDGTALGEAATGSPQTQSVTLRNDTLFATGLNARGIEYSIGTFTVHVTATNVIARGESEDVVANQFSGGSVSVTLDHSNYASVFQGGGAAATPAGSGSNQTASPSFVGAGSGDFHEAPGSPTIDAGVVDPANGATDLDGNPRTIASSTDIGAYEAAEAPTVVAEPPTGIGTSSATLHVSVNPNFSATNVQAYVGTSTGSETPLPSQSAGAGLAPVGMVFSTATLAPGTVYRYRFVATNGVSTSSSADQAFTTAGASAPPTPPAPALSGLSVKPRLFRALRGRGASIAPARRKRATTISYRDSQAGSTTLTVLRPVAGDSAGGRCVARTRHHSRHPRRCTRWVQVGSFIHRDLAGLNQFGFTGRINGRGLRPGDYRLQALARDSAGEHGRPLSTGFQILG